MDIGRDMSNLKYMRYRNTARYMCTHIKKVTSNTVKCIILIGSSLHFSCTSLKVVPLY